MARRDGHGGIIEYAPAPGTTRCRRSTPPASPAPAAQHGAGRAGRHDLGSRVPEVVGRFRAAAASPTTRSPRAARREDALCPPLRRGVAGAGLLPLAPGLAERLAAGAHAADIGCGTANAMKVLAAGIPRLRRSSATTSTPPRSSGRAGRRSRGWPTSLRRIDIAGWRPADLRRRLRLRRHPRQADPAAVLRRIHDALAPGGVFVMVEPRVSVSWRRTSRIRGRLRLRRQHAPLHDGLARRGRRRPGYGMGRAARPADARRAGFGPVTVHDAPGDPTNAVYVTHRPVS